ncbi:hypothetical protein HLY00_4315 [Mycolicibacterium hippocampi]|jgi:hypothetical protein|uniref:Transposase n=1 Tax=Mycolicibacterium hippocampi TaxID=659824 RepID=A0A850PUM9_9MYCO|nr:hypothetical protein [Mycolicibacterium hippocampi]
MPQDPDSVQRKHVDWLWLYHIGVHQGAVGHRPELSELGLAEVRRICGRMWVYSRANSDPDFQPNVRAASGVRRAHLVGASLKP